jgi:hypothetical protein
MSVEHVLMFILIAFVFYHFMYRCNRVEALGTEVINCHRVLRSECGHTAGSCADCNDCINKANLPPQCQYETIGEFCSLPEQQQENTLYLINDEVLKQDGKDKLMEILGKYMSGLMNGEEKKLKLKFGISNGYDDININIDDLQIGYSADESIVMDGHIGQSPQSELDFLNVFLSYYLMDGYRNKFHMFEFFIQKYTSDGLEPPIIINFTDDPNGTDDYTKKYNIKFSYYLC